MRKVIIARFWLKFPETKENLIQHFMGSSSRLRSNLIIILFALIVAQACQDTLSTSIYHGKFRCHVVNVHNWLVNQVYKRLLTATSAPTKGSLLTGQGFPSQGAHDWRRLALGSTMFGLASIP